MNINRRLINIYRR